MQHAGRATLVISIVVGAAVLGGISAVTRGADHDRPLVVSVRGATTVEGDRGTAALRFPVTLNRAAEERVTVRFAVAGGSAQPRRDYRLRTGIVTFEPGARSRQIVLRVIGDTRKEADETVRVTLTPSTNASLPRATVLGTILDDDGPGADAVRIAAAGDIACEAGDDESASDCGQFATSDLLVAGGYEAVLTLGDNQYPDGTLESFRASYGPSWGRVRGSTRPSPGNHDYHVEGAAGYFDYFGAAAGDRSKGYYSFDLGAWHLVALNSNCSDVSCDEGSEQERWLRADLAANRTKCTLAYWHHPRFSSGSTHGSSKRTEALYGALYEGGGDVVLWGHEHNYERFARTGPDGSPDPSRGLRLFVVGTGGASHYSFGSPLPTSEVRDSTSFGVLELTLRPGSYEWRFRPAFGSFVDSGSDTC